MEDIRYLEQNRPEPPRSGAPVEMVGAYLDFQRATMLWKTDGLSEEEVERTMTETGLSLLRILKHCGWVERYWFQYILSGKDVALGWTQSDPDADWRIEPGENYRSIRAFYLEQIDASREIARGMQWDDPARRKGADYTCGYVMSHMLEEISRHNGQVDLIREAIDGVTGE